MGADGVKSPVPMVFTWPPCERGSAKCPDAAPADESTSRDDWSYSPTMARLRPRVEEANQRAGGHR
ncbi:hypothetical protein ACIQ9E_15475 [Streptomyces sp. NPDC094448]|uniref:hypothetical protein n=1 Tax=Streptomyces sp. NPDC094448 TaxID=3366063 RepID=UPI0038075112